jgi:hypothetical protein
MACRSQGAALAASSNGAKHGPDSSNGDAGTQQEAGGEGAAAAGPGASLLHIITSQRDRFRAR